MIKVKLVNLNASIPKRNKPTDAGADLFSVESKIIPPYSREVFDTGIQIQSDLENTAVYHRIAPRSGLAAKHGIDVFAGVVDQAFTDNIKVILYNSTDKSYAVNVGDRIAQLITEVCLLEEFVEVDCLEKTDRGNSGFGSSGI